MSKSRRTFSREYKLRVVELSYERERIVELAKELDLRPELIYRWRAELKADASGSFPGKGKVSLSPEALENRRLQKALKEKELELEILKKAISIFSRRDGKSIDS